MNRRLLLLSYAFPPASLPEAFLSAKRLGSVPGLDVDVIALAPEADIRVDTSLDDYVAARFRRVERLRPPALLRRFAGGKISAVVQVPGFFHVVNSIALRKALRMQAERYDAIMTWSQWHSVHLVGLALKQRFPRLPWLAHFSDPWVDNPLIGYGPLRRAYERRLERKVYAAADVLTLTSPETMALVFTGPRARYRDRVAEMPHVFDRELYPTPLPPRMGKLLFRSLGAFYGARSPEPLFQALALLRQHQPTAFERMEVELIGSVPQHFLQSTVLQSLPAGSVRVLPPVDYHASLALMQSADALLNIDAPLALSPFLPSKLVDYIGAGRPIFGITPPGAAARVIAELGGWIAPPDRPDAIASVLAEALPAIEAARGKTWGAPDIRNRYSSVTAGPQLGEAIERAITRAQAA